MITEVFASFLNDRKKSIRAGFVQNTLDGFKGLCRGLFADIGSYKCVTTTATTRQLHRDDIEKSAVRAGSGIVIDLWAL